MVVILDSNVLIDYERGLLDVEEHIVGRPESFAISVITVSEFLHGVYRAQSSAQADSRRRFARSLFRRFQVLPIDSLTAETHARMSSSLITAGQMIGIQDSWIAATCLAHNAALVTRNVREFSRVPGLVIELW